MKRDEIWQVSMDPTIGTEIRKTRPCVIVNQDALAKLPLKIVVPLTALNVRFSKQPVAPPPAFICWLEHAHPFSDSRAPLGVGAPAF